MAGPRLPVPRRADGSYDTSGLSPPYDDAQRAAYRAIARLDHLDPTTAELVRLRNARIQGCRRCMGLRDARALRGGASEEILLQALEVDTDASSGRHRAALALADCFAARAEPPDRALAEALRAEMTTAQIIEAVLRLAIMSGNKVDRILDLDADEIVRVVYEPVPQPPGPEPAA